MVASSALTFLAALMGAVPLILAPFAEESWLLRRHGASYEEYRRGVPRFIALRKRGDAA